jgi:hypothetical protein
MPLAREQTKRRSARAAAAHPEDAVAEAEQPRVGEAVCLGIARLAPHEIIFCELVSGSSVTL